MDYSKGRFNVLDPQGSWVGRIDEDEFVRTPGPDGRLLFRLDGAEVYDMQGNFVGEISNDQVVCAGAMLFRIEPE